MAANPIFSAALQFAVLGTLGEILSYSITQKRAALPCSILELAGKVLAWALLGIFIKFGFMGMKGFTASLIAGGMLPQFMAEGIGWAFAVSVMTNIFFGPQMMFLHRIEDNIILREWSFEELKNAWWTLLWFWIPAHTVTFALPKDYQIGLAAAWSIVLGLIMGLTKFKKQQEVEI